MREIIEEMLNEMPGRFNRLYIFLPAYMTIFPLNFCFAIQAILCCPLFKMAQDANFVKNTKV